MQKKENKKINISKIIIWGIAIIILIMLIFASLGFRIKSTAGNAGTTSNGGSNADYSNLPEKCRPLAGQDIEAWKEHLSHHAETQECLQYFS